MRLLLIILFFISLSSIIGQDHTLRGKISGLQEHTIYIANFYGDQSNLADSVKTDGTGNFEYIINDWRPGFYRLIIPPDINIDVIYNEEDIYFTTSAFDPLKELEFIHSVENILWQDYRNKKNAALYRLELLNPLLLYYPQGEPFFQKVTDEYDKIQKNLLSDIKKIKSNHPGSMAVKFMEADKPPLIDLSLPVTDIEEYLKGHFFDNVTFNDPKLLRSKIVSTKIIEYLSLYRNPAYSKEEQEAQFKNAVDSILVKMMDNEEIYDFALKYLIDGFELFGFDNVVSHIVNNYDPSEKCLHKGENSELAKRMENLKKLSNGKNAPDFTLKPNHKDTLSLYGLDADYVLLVFWASWCPHCQDILPELQEIYEPSERSKFEIITISIDSSYSAFREYSDQYDFQWINLYEPGGWDNELAKLYSIYATPTMFLLDKERKILMKPANSREVKARLDDIR